MKKSVSKGQPKREPESESADDDDDDDDEFAEVMADRRRRNKLQKEEDEDEEDEEESHEEGADSEDSEDSEDSGESEDSGDEEEDDDNFSNLTFEELVQLKKQMGVKAFDKARKGQEIKKEGRKKQQEVHEKSSSKDAPVEVTSKKPVSRFRHVIDGTAEVFLPSFLPSFLHYSIFLMSHLGVACCLFVCLFF
jgi:hypothetical protein